MTPELSPHGLPSPSFAREDEPLAVKYCARQLCHGAGAIVGSLRDLKNTIVLLSSPEQIGHAKIIERLCQYESQIVLLSDLMQYARFEAVFLHHCVGRLALSRSFVDKARALTQQASNSKADPTIELLSKSIRELEDVADAARHLLDVEVSETTPEVVARDLIRRACMNFPELVRSLKNRSRGRPPLLVEDEYDLQYLFQGILKMDFHDVSAEVWTPTYAGKGSRMDFLVMPHRIVVETKFCRSGLGDGEIADQLIIDKDRYSKHSCCESLFCFVYDPGRFLKNPVRLERDLCGECDGLRTEVIVSPKAA